MPLPFRIGPKAGPVGLALTAFDIWRRLPPKQRRQLLEGARRHGPRLASAAAAAAAARAKRGPRPPV